MKSTPAPNDRRTQDLDGAVRTGLDKQARWGTSLAVEWLRAQGVAPHVITRALDPDGQVRTGDRPA